MATQAAELQAKDAEQDIPPLVVPSTRTEETAAAISATQKESCEQEQKLRTDGAAESRQAQIAKP